MRAFVLVLRVLALSIFCVAALHLVLGVAADAMLGATLPAEVLQDPTLNSQNRFYGMSFALYAVLLLLAAADVPRYRVALRALFAVFFVAGLTRLLSWFLDGQPSMPVVLLTATELLLPPMMLLWQRALLASSRSERR